MVRTDDGDTRQDADAARDATEGAARRRTRRALRGRRGAARTGRHAAACWPVVLVGAREPRSRNRRTQSRESAASAPPRYIEISNRRCENAPFAARRINRCGSRSARAPQQSTQPCFTCTAVSTRSHRLPTALSINSQSGRELSLSSEPTNQRHNNHHSSELHSTYNIPFGQARARAARRAAAPTCRRVVLSAKSRRAHMPTRCNERKQPPRPHADAFAHGGEGPTNQRSPMARWLVG